MSDLLFDIQDSSALLTINREQKRNAFDNHLLLEMTNRLEQAQNDPLVRSIILKANGAHFSAGADLNWMKSMASFTEEENLKDSLILAKLMYTLYQGPKPTIAMIQGSAFGGGAGLAAASSIAIAAPSARFCFSEVKLGLIPAVISPYVVKAVGERNAQMLFMTAEVFDASRALSLGLIQYCVPEEQLMDFTLNYAQQINRNAPEAVRQSLQLAHQVAVQPINQELMNYTASLIAQKRTSAEGQYGLNAFLNKETPNWN
ncbi:enoyl-CoA hydratase-related protein [Legionella sp. km772]|uniref:enoyl-CoA hydratase-related protein n=1 Tax=Legionella sp. km772 TaxID=2498111 RepID=UPI000F8D85B1|nr:enoyl-CoA hydratase-related protein [Legionella sp. km772]RUR10085.1 gamma-carboxygeranoyl-CoA hydratase [Legionella sp. km772]